MTKNESESAHRSTKHRIITPKFYIDNSHRVICESHSQIERIRVLSSLSDFPAFLETQQLEMILTCKKCKHYHDDVCYFPKSEIDKIEEDRMSRTFACKLCGGSIDRPMSIMYSLYNMNKFNVDIPTVCCTCYSSLEKKSYMEKSRQKMISTVLKLFLFTFALFIDVFAFRYIISLVGNLFLGIGLVSFIFLGASYSIFKDSRDLMFLMRGRKYYKKTYGKMRNTENGKYIDDFPFN